MMDFLIENAATSLLLVGLAVIWVLWIFREKHDCWEKQGVPCVKTYPFFGSLLEDFKKPLHEAECDRYKKHGSVYGYFQGSRPMLSVGDPNLLRNILIKDFQFFADRRGFKTGDKITESMVQNLKGEDWKRIRSIISPTFSTGKIKRMMNIYKTCAEILVRNFRLAAAKGEPVETKRLFGAFSMDVIASAAFSTKIDSHNDPENEFAVNARSVFGRFNWRFVFYLLFPRIMSFLSVPIFPQKGVNFFRDVTLQIIEQREKTGKKGNDFLQLLIDAAKEQIAEDANEEKTTDTTLSNYEEETNDQVFKNYKPKKSLSSYELVGNCVIFFLAGYETTGSTLAFASYYLANNLEAQEKLLKEVDEAISECNGDLTYEVIQNMRYLDNVLSETLRLSPPAIRLERLALEDYDLGFKGIRIPKDAVVTVPVFAMHRDEKYFPDPLKFDPDRFSADNKDSRVPYTFMPFGAGPRNCIGMRFAIVELKVCMVKLLEEFRIKKCPETKLEFNMGQGLLQPRAIKVLMERRNKK